MLSIIFLGHFKNIIEAAMAYNEAALNYWGNDAFINTIEKENP